MQTRLRADIDAARAEAGIRRIDPAPVVRGAGVQGGTMGAARTDIEGFADRLFRGASPQAGGTPDPTFPPANPTAVGHAEQNLAGAIDGALTDALQSGALTRGQLQGRRVWMRIEQDVCSSCRAGLEDPKVTAGVLKQLSEKYPELTFEIEAAGTNEQIIIQAGRRLN